MKKKVFSKDGWHFAGNHYCALCEQGITVNFHEIYYQANNPPPPLLGAHGDKKCKLGMTLEYTILDKI